MAERVIETFSGRAFDLLTPRTGDVCLRDIAHSLANINRFTGHAKFPYSVAQHCVLGSYMASSQRVALAFLLHDAQEAYVGDVSSPLKSMLSGFHAVEGAAVVVVREALALPVQMSTDVAEVAEIDARMLSTEVRDLLPPRPDLWRDYANPYDEISIQRWTWEFAKGRYLHRYKELTHGR